MSLLKKFWQEEEGITTVEILLILAVLVIIAVLFRNTIIKWVESILANLLPDQSQTTNNVESVQPGGK